jgi:hypothetical protein
MIQEMPGREKPDEGKDKLEVTVPEKRGQCKKAGYQNEIMYHGNG